MTRSRVLAFLLSVTVTSVATISMSAQARLIPAASCSKGTSANSFPTLNAESYVTVAAVAGSVFCGYQDLSGDGKSAVTEILVDVSDGATGANGGVTARACSQPFTGASIHCGSTISSGDAFTGATTVTLSGTDVTNAWGSSFDNDYGSVEVFLPASSKVFGITTL